MTWTPKRTGKQLSRLDETMFSEKEIAKFNSRFVKRGENECWPWTYHAGHVGHGRMWAQGRNTLASHIALAIDGRTRPEKWLCALHSCDNPSCVNPHHLRWGTQSENIRDRVERGRNGAPRGTAQGSSKLDEAAVIAIRRDSRPARQIAQDYSVSQVLISAVKRGAVWSWVNEMGSEKSREAAVSGVQRYTEAQA